MDRNKFHSKAVWAKKVISEPMPNGKYPKFFLFHVEDREEPGDNCTVTFAVKVNDDNTVEYGFSVRSLIDNQWKAYGKALAKSRLLGGASFTVGNAENHPVGIGGAVYQSFLTRLVAGDLNGRFPGDVNDILTNGQWYQIQPPVKNEENA